MPQLMEETQAPVRRRLAVDEDGIEFLARAARTAPIGSELITETPISDVTAALDVLVKRLRTLNIRTVLGKQGLLDQLTGADLEARLRFELEVRGIVADVRTLDNRAGAARRARQALRKVREDIEGRQAWLANLIATARRVLDRSDDADAMLRERFERRLLNLTTLETSNLLTVEQVRLADGNLALLTDRIEDVTGPLFTLWQRDAMALAQSPGQLRKASPLVDAFMRSHDAFLAKFN